MENLETILIVKEKLEKRMDEYCRLFDRERIANIVRQIDVSYYSGIEDISLISFVWLYYRWLKAQYKNLYQKKCNNSSILKVIISYNWLKNTFKFINSDTDRKLNEQEIIILGKFVAFFKYFQGVEGCFITHKTTADPTLLEITNRRGLKKEYAIGSFFTLEQFKQTLIPDIIRDNKLILIKSSNYATALFKEKKNYYYLNNNGNETKTLSINELAILVFQDHQDSPVGLEIFSLDEEHKKYPPVKNILKKINPVLFTKDNCPKVSGLEIAAKIGSLDSTEYFLKEGCSTDTQISKALNLSSKYGHYEIVKALLQNNRSIDINKPDDNGNTILILASQHGRPEIIKLLLARNDIDVNAIDKNYELPPLTWAVSYNNIGAVKLLLEDRRVNINDFGAQKFVVLLSNNFHTEFTERIRTPLLMAAWLGYLEIVKLLLAHKDIDPNLQNDEGYSPLMRATECNHIEIVKALLKHKDIDPNTEARNGETALVKALRKRNFKIANLLLLHPKIDRSVKAKYQWVNFIQSIIPKTEVISPLCHEESLWFYKKNKRIRAKEYPATIESLTKNRLTIALVEQKIKQYLEFKNRVSVNFFDDSYFNNIFLLLLYVRWLQLQSELSEKDYVWLESVIKLISNWESSKSLLKTDVAKIEKFISLLGDMQCIKKELLSIWQKNNQRQYFEIGHYLLFTLEQLRKTLEKENVVQNNKIVFFISDDQAVALFKHNEIYHLFGLHNQVLETEVSSIEELAQLFFTSFKKHSGNASLIDFFAFSFDRGLLEYLRIMLAAKTGGLESGRYFLNRGINAVDCAMIFEKAAYHGHIDVVRALLSYHSVNPNIQDSCGKTALMQAVNSGNLEVVKELLAHKDIDPNIQDMFGNNALVLAYLFGSSSVFVSLLNNPDADFSGIDLEYIRNKCMCEKNNFRLDPTICENRFNIIKELLEHPKINRDICNNNYLDVIQSIIIVNNIKIVEKLLTNKNYFGANNVFLGSILVVSAQRGYIELVKILLAQPNINPNVKDANGSTALIEASKNGYAEIVKSLLAHPDINPNIQMETEYNWSAIVYAAKCNHPEIVGILLTHPKIDTRLRDKDGKIVFQLINQFLNNCDETSSDIDKCTSEQDIQKKLQEKIGQYIRFKSDSDIINPLLFEIIKDRELKKEYSIGALFTLEQLSKALEELKILQDNKLVIITSYNNTAVLFRNKGKCYFTNASNRVAATPIASIKKLAKLVFIANSYKPEKPSPLGLEIFAFDKKGCAEYPPPKNILNNINAFLVTNLGYANNCSGLQMAAMVNSIESLRFFLEKGVSPNVRDNDDVTALLTASKYGYLDIVKELIAHKNIIITGSNKKTQTALDIACKNDHYEIVQKLLGRFYIWPDDVKRIILPKMIEERHFKIVKTLLGYSIDTRNKYKGDALIDVFINDHLKVIDMLNRHDNFLLCEDCESKALNEVVVKIEQVDNEILINNSLDLSQKLKCYLKHKGKDQSFLDYFDDGYCCVIPFIWAYIKQLKYQVNKNREYNWFMSVVELINHWDAVRKLEEQEIVEIEKLIALILEMYSFKSYLVSIWQAKYEFKKYKLEYYLLSTADQLKKTLEAEDSQLTLIKLEDNITALFKYGHNYFYFNPNSAISEIKVSSIGELAKIIFETRNQNQTNNAFLYPKIFCVLSFDADFLKYLGLMLITKTGSLCSKQYLLSRGLNLNECAIAIRKAAYHGHIDIVRALSASDVDPNAQDEYGYTALMLAVDQGQLEIVKELLAYKNINPNLQSKNGLTALALAFMFEELETVRILLKDKKDCLAYIDGNLYKKMKARIVLDAKRQQNHIEIIKALLAYPGINPQTKDNNGWNSLAWIYNYDSYKIVNELLKNPTNCLNFTGQQGLTVLIEAAKNGCPEVVKTLLKQVESNSCIKQGFSAALIKAAENDHAEVVKTLLAHPDIDVNAKDCLGYTALIEASCKNHIEVTKILLSHPNIDPNTQNTSNHTALIRASIYGYIDIVKALLSHPKIDVNIQGVISRYTDLNEDSWPAVVYAAKEGYREVVDLLLKHPNIDTNMRTKNGLTVSKLVEQFLRKDS